jgi:hypothetical protein
MALLGISLWTLGEARQASRAKGMRTEGRGRLGAGAPRIGGQTMPAHAAEDLNPALAALVDRIADAVGSSDERPWWTKCAKRVGLGAVDRALGQLKETRQLSSVRNPGGLLTKVFKDFAIEAGIALH